MSNTSLDSGLDPWFSALVRKTKRKKTCTSSRCVVWITDQLNLNLYNLFGKNVTWVSNPKLSSQLVMHALRLKFMQPFAYPPTMRSRIIGFVIFCPKYHVSPSTHARVANRLPTATGLRLWWLILIDGAVALLLRPGQCVYCTPWPELQYKSRDRRRLLQYSGMSHCGW
jgi:hypothetical protein